MSRFRPANVRITVRLSREQVGDRLLRLWVCRKTGFLFLGRLQRADSTRLNSTRLGSPQLQSQPSDLTAGCHIGVKYRVDSDRDTYGTRCLRTGDARRNARTLTIYFKRSASGRSAAARAHAQEAIAFIFPAIISRQIASYTCRGLRGPFVHPLSLHPEKLPGQFESPLKQRSSPFGRAEGVNRARL